MSDSQASADASSILNDPRQLAELRQQMLRFAELQIGDTHMAEDAVQEALSGAMKNAGSFAGKAAFKSWVFAILRNKIADILRKRQRLAEVSATGEDGDDIVDQLFDQHEHWQPSMRPKDLGDPELAFGQQQFWVVLEHCLTQLPDHQARVFMMREFIGLDSSEICQQLALSTSNLHVLLHRARLRLQACLTKGWLDEGRYA